MSGPTSPDHLIEDEPAENPAQAAAHPDEQGELGQPKSKVKEVFEKAKEGFDNLGDQKIGAKIGDPA